MKPVNALFAMPILTLCACAAQPLRGFDDGVFVSRADPPMRVRIAPGFEYLGSDSFMLGDSHAVERHHWVRSEDREVTALVQFQFERILDGFEGSYQFNVPPEQYIAGSNYRFAPGPVRLGDHDWVHNTWAFDNRVSAAENPGKESARTLALLAARGYRIDNGMIMARYVRAVGEDRRKEVILFYMEPLGRNAHAIEDFPEGGPRSAGYDRLSAAVVARGREAFEILPDPPL